MDFTLSNASELATAIGLAVAAYQLYQGRVQETTNFEDTLAQEYRNLAGTIPSKALLGENLSPGEMENHMDEFYHYFDLSNSQIFLRQIGRVSSKTFTYWADGIKSHLARPAFSEAWKVISTKAPGDFKELRKLIHPL